MDSMNIKERIRAALQTRLLLAQYVSQIYRLALALQASVGLCFRFPHAYIASDVRMIGISRIRFGRNVVIGNGSVLNVNDRSPKCAALSIGANTFIGVQNFFTVGHSIRLGEYCLTTMNCAFIGSTHRYDNPMNAYLTAGTKMDDDIYVGANCFFGCGAQVLGNVHIGHGCVIGAAAVVRNDIPPFSLVVGNPARVIKRFDFSANMWVPWPCDNIAEGPQEAEYVEHLRRQHGFVIQPISVAAKRFGNVF
jgi:acetyltransferase-like isoleucine patch superfamily enzyme